MVCLFKNQSHYFLMTLYISFYNAYYRRCKYVFWNARPKYFTQLVEYFIIKAIRALSNYNANPMLPDSSDNAPPMGTSVQNFILFKYCHFLCDL